MAGHARPMCAGGCSKPMDNEGDVCDWCQNHGHAAAAVIELFKGKFVVTVRPKVTVVTGTLPDRLPKPVDQMVQAILLAAGAAGLLTVDNGPTWEIVLTSAFDGWGNAQ